MPSAKPEIGKNDLLSQRPDIAAEWDYSKNKMRPEDYRVTSSKSVYWRDSLGHSWQAVIGNRTREKSGCPYCAGKKVLKGFNDLASQYPELLPEWDTEKNGISPDEVVCVGHKKYHWRCMYGHEWVSAMYLRTLKHHGCPYCDRKGTSFPEQAIFYYLKKEYPDAINGDMSLGVELDIFIPSIRTAIEYDGIVFHLKDRQIERDNTKDSLCSENNIRLIRVREHGLPNTSSALCIERKDNESDEDLDRSIEEIFSIIGKPKHDQINVSQDHIMIRSQYYAGLKEKSLAEMRPDLAKEWYFEKNGRLSPEMFSIGSSTAVWWQCSKYKNHIWKDSIAHRTAEGRGCPYCSNERILTGFNDLASRSNSMIGEWSPNNSIPPTKVFPNSHKKYLWICPKCKQEYSASPANRMKGKGCPYCAHIRPIIGKTDFKTLYKDIALEWDYAKNGNKRPEEFLPGSEYKAWWICPKGHSFQQAISKRAIRGQGCPYCNGNKIIPEENDLTSQRPDLASQWMEKHNGKSASEVAVKSNMKAWWKCPICGKEWQAYVCNRTKAIRPYCNDCNRRLKKEGKLS